MIIIFRNMIFSSIEFGNSFYDALMNLIVKLNPGIENNYDWLRATIKEFFPQHLKEYDRIIMLK